MKKTFSANINGRIFNIDEDAYQLLQNYLHQLHDTFGGDEGAEIVSDIEARISEHFAEQVATGTNVIVLADVNHVIETMGRPEDLSGGQEGTPGAVPPPFEAPEACVAGDEPVRRRLYRNMQDKVFGGVISGLGTYLGWEIWIMRLGVALLACFTYFWPITIVYMIAWMVIPAAKTPRQILEMHGEPVNLGTISRTILRGQQDTDSRSKSEAERLADVQSKQGHDALSGGMRFITNIIMGIVGFFAALCGIGLVIAILACIAAFIGAFITPDTIFDQIPFAAPRLAFVTAIVASCFALIPVIGLTWVSACVVFNAPAAGKKTIISLVVVDMILLVATIVLGMVLSTYAL